MKAKKVWGYGRHFVYVIGGVLLARVLLHFFSSFQIIHFFAIELHIMVAAFIVGAIVGERGWLYGLSIAVLNIVYFLIVVHPASFLNFMATMMTTRLSTITYQLIAGITGGLLGGLVHLLIRYLEVRTRRLIAVLALIGMLLFFLVFVPWMITLLRVESLLRAPRIVALFDILMVAIIIIINVSLIRRKQQG